MSVPIIDITGIDDPASQRRIAEEVTAACKNWGFLLIKGHPIPASHIEQMFGLGKRFFDLPEADKAGFPISDKSMGYIGSFADRNKDDKSSMWFGGVPGDLEAYKRQSLPPFWHDHVATVETFKHECHGLVIKLLECFALALGLDRKFFADAHKEDVGNGNSLRMLMYPARPEKPVGSIGSTGSRMAAHTDSGSVTLLFQRAAGLEVQSPSNPDEWVKAPCKEGCILVNLGDALSFWSGGQLKATLHRVTFDGLPHDRERQSMAYFGAANPETILEPIVPGRTMTKYYSNGLELKPGVTVGELSRMIMTGIYGASTQTRKDAAALPTSTATATAVV